MNVPTIQENSQTITKLFEAAFGPWKDYPKRPVTFYDNKFSYDQITHALDGRFRRRENGVEVRALDHPMPGTLSINGRASLELDGIKYEFYYGYTTQNVLTKTGPQVSIGYTNISFTNKFKDVDPSADRELFMFLMLSQFHSGSPVYWRKKGAHQWGSTTPLNKPKYNMFDKYAKQEEEKQRTLDTVEIQSKIGLMDAVQLEMLCKAMDCMPKGRSGDMVGDMRYNLHYASAKNPTLAMQIAKKIGETASAIKWKIIDGDLEVREHEGQDWWFYKGEPATKVISGDHDEQKKILHMMQHIPEDIKEEIKQEVGEHRDKTGRGRPFKVKPMVS